MRQTAPYKTAVFQGFQEDCRGIAAPLKHQGTKAPEEAHTECLQKYPAEEKYAQFTVQIIHKGASAILYRYFCRQQGQTSRHGGAVVLLAWGRVVTIAEHSFCPQSLNHLMTRIYASIVSGASWSILAAILHTGLKSNRIGVLFILFASGFQCHSSQTRSCLMQLRTTMEVGE